MSMLMLVRVSAACRASVQYAATSRNAGSLRHQTERKHRHYRRGPQPS